MVGCSSKSPRDFWVGCERADESVPLEWPAFLAKVKHIPVSSCCESFKKSNKVQTQKSRCSDSRRLVRKLERHIVPTNLLLKPLNSLYDDVTLAEFVGGILLTKVGIISPTRSIAVLLREMNPHDAAY